MTAALENEIFTDTTKAREWLETELWPDGPVCPHCGVLHRATKVQGKSHRVGLYMCNECRLQYTVTVGTVMEQSHIPLNKWLMSFFLLSASKKGMSTHQLHRMLGVSYKAAWFMMHRIREGMRDGQLAPMGGAGGIVEADETFIGREPGKEKKRSFHHKMKVLSLIDRDTKQARSMVVAAPILRENMAREARLATDEAGHYLHVGKEFAEHGVVRHGAEEYVRGEIHTNTLEGYFSVFKRGMKGTYQHCGKKHLHRYLAEFDFRFSATTTALP